MWSNFYTWGLYVGRIAGIRVRIHWSLLLWWATQMLMLPHGFDLGVWGFAVVLGFICILLHELGHCFAARYVGGRADEVLLWPLGGLAFCDAPHRPSSQFIVAAGGPLVTAALAAGAFTASFLVPGFSENTSNDFVWAANDVLIRWQSLLLLLNLVPIYPLDGGRMFHSGLWGALGRWGKRYDAYGRATITTLWVARATAVLGVIVSLYFGALFCFFIFLWAWFGAESLKQFPHQDAGSDLVFGYDFSQGYTSLERGWQRAERRGGARRAKRTRFGAFLARIFRRRVRSRRVEEPGYPPAPQPPPATLSAADEEADEKRRVDELLEKISRGGGVHALTRREREFLDKVSRRWAR